MGVCTKFSVCHKLLSHQLLSFENNSSSEINTVYCVSSDSFSGVGLTNNIGYRAFKLYCRFISWNRIDTKKIGCRAFNLNCRFIFWVQG